MDTDTHLQNSVQNSPQQQAQTNPSPGGPSPPDPGDTRASCPPPIGVHDANDAAAKALKRLLRALGKTFGPIPGVPIFTQWDKRLDCSNSAVHRPVMAGICGNKTDGAFSIALSSLYEDDEDGGDVIIYTGTGGRQQWTDTFPPKRLRLGPQIADQSWDQPQNSALIVSYHTGNPVRVIRSSRCPSQYAPLRGYRYDGLYRIAAYWTARGLKGRKICRCRLERLPDQPPIPVRPIIFPASSRRIRGGLVSRLAPNPSTSTNDTDIGPNQPNTSPAQLTGSAERESTGFSSPLQQREMPEISTTGEVDPGMKLPQSTSHQRRDSPKFGVPLTYKWHPRKNRLVMLPASRQIQEDINIAEGDEEEHRGEDDATLVQSEDDHAINERMETEYFPDEDN